MLGARFVDTTHIVIYLKWFIADLVVVSFLLAVDGKLVLQSLILTGTIDVKNVIGIGGVSCEMHGIINHHKYCSHTSDDADHKWHYTRAE